MKKYWILWTYIANYSKLIEVEAKDPTDALDSAVGCFSKDFQSKASVYVFDHSPVFVRMPSK